ncbi:MAG: monosaccharide transporter ATP-binding protein [Conexibacter sp.]|nr:monosaccharide transporter ATP-binding protein [Conexibacter sp.]
MAETFLAVDGVTKRYPGVTALSGVSLELRRGEVHGLIGENGAGKSTLIRIMTGATRPDEGTVAIDGAPVTLSNPGDARRRGVVGIFQELTTQPWLTVGDNILLGDEPTVGPGRQVLARRRGNRRAREVLARLDAAGIPISARAGDLSTAQKQLLEIGRAMALDAPLIIMDEPTASLPDRDADRLLGLIDELRTQGRTVLYVSHRLDEIRRIADRVTVLRGGRHVTTAPTAELDLPRMIELMLGRPAGDLFPPRNDRIGEPLLRVRGLSRQRAFSDISFDVRAGEVLGFSGLIGAGRSEVMRAVCGAEPAEAGTVEVAGAPVRLRSPRDAIRAGIAYLPEDRKEQGLVLGLSGRENIALASMRRFTPGGVMRRRAMERETGEISRALQLRGSLDAEVRTLSGGNQQKIVIGKALLTNPRVLIFDEPTRGIDVGAKREVYRLIHEAAGRGAAVILVSSELPEVVNVAHRILVMSSGRIHDELTQDEFDDRRILTAAFAGHVARIDQTEDER